MVAVRHTIIIIYGDLPQLNECTTMVSVNNVTRSTETSKKYQNFLNFSITFGAILECFYYVPTSQFLRKQLSIINYELKIIQHSFLL